MGTDWETTLRSVSDEHLPESPVFDDIQADAKATQQTRTRAGIAGLVLAVAVGLPGAALLVTETDDRVETSSAETADINQVQETDTEAQSGSGLPETQEMSSMLEIPDVTGQSIDSALSQIESLGLTGTINFDVDEPGDPEHVARTFPASGETVELGSAIVLLAPPPLPPQIPEDSDELIQLGQLISSRTDLFVGFSIDDDGTVSVAINPDALEVEVASQLQTISIPNIEFRTCPHSYDTLHNVRQRLIAGEVGYESTEAFGVSINPDTCSVSYTSSVTPEQVQAIAEIYGNLVTVYSSGGPVRAIGR